MILKSFKSWGQTSHCEKVRIRIGWVLVFSLVLYEIYYKGLDVMRLKLQTDLGGERDTSGLLRTISQELPGPLQAPRLLYLMWECRRGCTGASVASQASTAFVIKRKKLWVCSTPLRNPQNR